MRRSQSIVRIVVIGTLLAILVTAAVTNFIIYLIDIGTLRRDMQELAFNVVRRLEFGVQKPLWDFDRQQVDTLVRLEMGQKNLLAVLVRETNGHMYSGFVRDREGIHPYTNDYLQRASLKNSLLADWREIYYQAVKIGQIEVYLAREYQEERSRRLFMRFLLQVLISSAAISLVITYILRRYLSQPLYELMTVVRRFGKRDLDVRVKNIRDHELGELSRSFNEMATTIQVHNQQLEQIVEERTRELTEKNEKILESIHYAMRLQDGILPSQEMLRLFFSGYFVLWRPRDLVGGDFYWSHETEGNHLLAVVDCTGHGVSGALMTMTSNALLNHIIEDICCDDPALILVQLNKLLKRTLHQKYQETYTDDGLEIGICLVRPALGELLYAGARLSLFVWSEDGSIQVIRGDRQAIGYKRSRLDYSYTRHRIPLQPGMRFYLSSDGFFDQNGAEHPFGIGPKRFQQWIEAAASIPIEEQGTYFEEALSDWMGTEPQRDDITLIGFTVRGDD